MAPSSGGRRAVAVAVGATVAAFGLGSGLLVLGTELLARSGIVDPPPSGPVLLVLNFVVLQGVAFVGVAAAVLRLRDEGVEDLPLRRPDERELVEAVVGFGVLFLAAIAGGAVVRLLGLEPARNVIADVGLSSPRVLLALIPVSFLIIGPGEELLFRGVVQRRLRDAFSVAPAIGGASLLFALPHAFALTGGGRSVTLAVLFALGIVLGWFYERTDNLVVPILMHGGYNAFLFGVLYVAATTGALPAG